MKTISSVATPTKTHPVKLTRSDLEKYESGVIIALVSKYFNQEDWEDSEAHEYAMDVYFSALALAKPGKVTKKTPPPFYDPDDHPENKDIEENGFELIYQNCAERLARGYQYCSCGEHPSHLPHTATIYEAA